MAGAPSGVWIAMDRTPPEGTVVTRAACAGVNVPAKTSSAAACGWKSSEVRSGHGHPIVGGGRVHGRRQERPVSVRLVGARILCLPLRDLLPEVREEDAKGQEGLVRAGVVTARLGLAKSIHLDRLGHRVGIDAEDRGGRVRDLALLVRLACIPQAARAQGVGQERVHLFGSHRGLHEGREAVSLRVVRRPEDDRTVAIQREFWCLDKAVGKGRHAATGIHAQDDVRGSCRMRHARSRNE